jgi:hypothetical protein
MFDVQLIWNEDSLKKTLYTCTSFLQSYNSFCLIHVVSEETIFKIQPFRNKNSLWLPYYMPKYSIGMKWAKNCIENCPKY